MAVESIHSMLDQLKQIACDAIEHESESLHKLSVDIWEHPELNFEEHFAHDRLTSYLEERKFPVERNFVLDTGFRCVVGSASGPNVAILCEYDALPQIGHACGHNLIAEVGVGASIGVKAAFEAAKEDGIELGTLTVLGTPAEEGGCGKGRMIATGVFQKIDAAMMSHPIGGPVDAIVTDVPLIALKMINVRYSGKASHAAGFPWEGINALDAAVMAYTSISCMRQQMKPTWRTHGVITNGGAKPNIIPEETAMEYYLRAPTVKEVNILRDKMLTCFRAAATATGCQVEIIEDEWPWDNVMTNKTMADLYTSNANKMGAFPVPQNPGQPGGASTDMGNVTHVVPGIHPCYSIGTTAVNHTRGFTEAAGHPKAQESTLLQAKLLAMTAIDLYCEKRNLEKAKEEFKEDIAKEV